MNFFGYGPFGMTKIEFNYLKNKTVLNNAKDVAIENKWYPIHYIPWTILRPFSFDDYWKAALFQRYKCQKIRQ